VLLFFLFSHFRVKTAPKDRNYADFKRDFSACAGVCIAGYDFEWTVPRGSGSVSTSDPAMFTWASDSTPEGLTMMGYMKLKMQMPMKITDIKNALNGWNGVFIQCNSPEELDPDFVVPKLHGGRMGAHTGNFNADGMALWKQLTEELGSAGVGPGDDHDQGEEPVVEEPKEPSKPAKTPVPSAPEAGFSALSHDEIKAIVEAKVSEAAERRMPEIFEAAAAAARKAVEDATKDKVRQETRVATNAIASLAFQAGAESVEEQTV